LSEGEKIANSAVKVMTARVTEQAKRMIENGHAPLVLVGMDESGENLAVSNNPSLSDAQVASLLREAADLVDRRQERGG
jgi:hypothetical protein